MADGNSNSGVLYAVIGALAVVVVGGGVYMFKDKAMSVVTPPLIASPVTTAPAPAPPVAAAAQPAPAPVVPADPTAAQLEQVRGLVNDARRAVTRGDFASADRALDQAQRIDPRSSDVIAARRDLRDAQQSTARKDQRVDALVAQARAAIARHDYVAGDRALDEAERIDGRDRDVQQARAALDAAQRPGQPPPRR